MIQPTSGSMIIPSNIADSVWINTVTLAAISPRQNASLSIRLVPYNSSSGEIFDSFTQTLKISNLPEFANQYPCVQTAIDSFYCAVQQLIISKSLF